MSTSTIEARRAPAKRLGVFLAGVAVAFAGAFSLSASQANADPVQIEFDKGAINLGAAFKGQQIMPAPKVVSGARAAYWWDAADTGYAATATGTWATTVNKTPNSATPSGAPWNGGGIDQNPGLFEPLNDYNVCSTNYGAFPPKGSNVASTAQPNRVFPCLANPSGGTVGSLDQGWEGYTPCATVLSTGCFAQTPDSEGNILARGWEPLDTTAAPYGVAAANAIATASGGAIPATFWGPPFSGGTPSGPNNPASGEVPLGFLDQVIPVSDSSLTEVYSGANNTRTYDIKIGANAFRFPLMVVPSPVDGSPVPITLAVTGAPFTPTTAAGKTEDQLYVKGSFNPATGAMSLSGALEARVLVGLGIQATPASPAYPADAPADQKGGPTPFVYCATPLEDLTLTTTGASTESGGFPGTPYLDGINGEGAIAGTFNITKDSVPTVLAPWASEAKYTGAQAPNCATVNTVTKGAGAIWLGSGQDIDVPVCAEDEVGNYPDCAKAETNFAKPTLKVKKSVKGGKKLAVTVKVKNNGNVEGTANVRVQTSNGKVKAPTLAVKIAVDPGKTGSKTVKLATKRGSKGKVTVYATTNDKTGKATTKVK